MNKRMRKNHRKLLQRTLSCALILILIFGLLPSNPVRAASGFKIYDYQSKSTITKSHAALNYIINGKKMNLTNTPGILTDNGVALASYDVIFKDTLKVTSSYKKSTGKITFKTDNKTVVLTVGSKIAEVNGTKVTINAAPMRVKYKSSGKITAVVPTRFVAETLGFYYHWNSISSTITIESPLRLNYDGKDVDYTGVKGMVRVNGKSVKLGKTPSVVISNQTMLRVKQVFEAALGAKYTYKSSTGAIKLKAGDITLTMKIGSRDAYINGKKAILPIAPKIIKNRENKTSYVYVPGSFTASALGYKYVWDAASKTALITSTDHSGDKPIIDEIEFEEEKKPDTNYTSYFKWDSNPSMKEELTKAANAVIHNITAASDSDAINVLESIYKEETDGNIEKYLLSFQEPVQGVDHSFAEGNLLLTLNKTMVSQTEDPLGGTIVDSVRSIYDDSDATSIVTFLLASEYCTYELELSKDGKHLAVIFYPNYLVSAVAGTGTSGDFLTLTGSLGMEAEVHELENTILITIPNMVPALEEYLYSEKDSSRLSYCKISTNETELTIELNIPDSRPSYTFETEGNQFKLTFDTKSDNSNQWTESPMFIPLPKEVKFSKISDQDLYYNRSFELYIPGDQRSFYEKNPIKNTYSSVEQMQVRYLSNNTTAISFTTSRVKGYRYVEAEGGLSLTIANPSQIYSKIIVLDAGHGGTDPGTVHGGYNEKDVNFSILWNYARSYFESSDIKAYFSRYDDTLVPLASRAAYASEVEADFFVSLHQNSNSNSAINGTSIYYSTINTPVGPSGLTSRALASMYLNGLTSALGTKNMGIIDKGFVVVRDNTVPSVLLELAFMSNKMELALVTSAKFQENAAAAIYSIAQNVFAQYPTGR